MTTAMIEPKSTGPQGEWDPDQPPKGTMYDNFSTLVAATYGADVVLALAVLGGQDELRATHPGADQTIDWARAVLAANTTTAIGACGGGFPDEVRP